MRTRRRKPLAACENEIDLSTALVDEDHIRLAILSVYARGATTTPAQKTEIDVFFSTLDAADPEARAAFELIAGLVADAILHPILTGRAEDLPDWVPEPYADRFMQELVTIAAELQAAGITPPVPTAH